MRCAPSVGRNPMAAASDLVDRAVRTKQVKERGRQRAQGAFGHEDKTARRARNKEAGKLDEWERAELLLFWSGNEVSVVRSVQGAVEERLLRAPPRIGAELEREVEAFLVRRGHAGAPREKLVELLAAENVGATRHEARMTLRRMVGAGRVEFFVEDVSRKKACTCKSALGEVEGSVRQRGACRCGSGVEETVPTPMVRLGEKGAASVPARLKPAERWARADAELEAICHTIHCGESTHSGGSRLPPQCRAGGGRARGALRRVAAEHAEVLERVYGANRGLWEGQLSPEASKLVTMTATYAKAKEEVADAKVRELGHWGNPDAMDGVRRATHVHDVLRAKLDAAPADELGKVRWGKAKEIFVAAVERESLKLLLDAVLSYREARG